MILYFFFFFIQPEQSLGIFKAGFAYLIWVWLHLKSRQYLPKPNDTQGDPMRIFINNWSPLVSLIMSIFLLLSTSLKKQLLDCFFLRIFFKFFPISFKHFASQLGIFNPKLGLFHPTYFCLYFFHISFLFSGIY